MFTRHALIRKSDGLVVNAVKAELGWEPPAEFTAEPDDTGALAVGGTYIGGVYTPPVSPPPPDHAAIDQSALNAALAEPGSVVRALGLVMFGEINKLRVKNGDPAYTMPQFVAALKAQMR